MNPPEWISEGASGRIPEWIPVEIAYGTSGGFPNKHLKVSLNSPGAIWKIPEQTLGEITEGTSGAILEKTPVKISERSMRLPEVIPRGIPEGIPGGSFEYISRGLPEGIPVGTLDETPWVISEGSPWAIPTECQGKSLVGILDEFPINLLEGETPGLVPKESPVRIPEGISETIPEGTLRLISEAPSMGNPERFSGWISDESLEGISKSSWKNFWRNSRGFKFTDEKIDDDKSTIAVKLLW